MRRKLALLATLASVLVLGTSAANAITYGQPDTANTYDYVGLVVFYDSSGAPLWRCSGTLLSPTLFVTAAHCTEAPAASAQVWVDVTMPAGYPWTGGTTGTPTPHPGWTGALTLPNTSDLGVVELDAAVTASTYAVLPAVGFLDPFATARGQQDRIFTQVGYGLQGIKPVYSAQRTRYVATSMLVNLRSALTDGYNVQFANNPGKGNGVGGTCFGDSGGPAFYGGTNIIVAVTSFGLNQNCKGVDFSYRLDTSYAQGWLAGF